MAFAQPDPRVLRAASQGDQRAFQTIVEAYRQPILRYVERFVRDPCLAEDITQEVFLRAYQHLPTFSDRCLFTTWLFQVTKNRIIDQLRAEKRRPQPELSLEALLPLEAHDTHGEHSETVGAIWQAIADLDQPLKMSLLLRDVAGLTYIEIAEALEADLGTVKWRIYKAREAVQQAVTHQGLELGHGRRRSEPKIAPAGATASLAAPS